MRLISNDFKKNFLFSVPAHPLFLIGKRRKAGEERFNIHRGEEPLGTSLFFIKMVFDFFSFPSAEIGIVDGVNPNEKYTRRSKKRSNLFEDLFGLIFGEIMKR